MVDPINKADVVRMKALLFEAIEQLPVIMEFAKIDAKQTRAKYLALVAEGFTPEQAIELYKRS